MQLGEQRRFSYRDDAAVPAFADDGPIVFMDGECVLCSQSARLLTKLDRKGEFRICPMQSDIGQAVLRHYGLDPGNPDTWLYLVDGYAYTSLDGIVKAGRRLGGWGLMLWPLSLLPRTVQDWLYRRVARNRYALFGRTAVCMLPDPRLRERILT
jgi:predicted DCC family thiol-disulfide oxidoreductase YuxK